MTHGRIASLLVGLALLPRFSCMILRGGSGKSLPTPEQGENESGEAVLEDVWTKTKAFLEKNGAHVHPGLRLAMTEHGGASIRGLVTTHDIPAGTTLTNVPKTLFLNSDSFPDLKKADLSRLHGCSYYFRSRSREELKNFKVAVGLAIEMRKGEDSFWAPYLTHLPTQMDFKQFFPALASDAVKSDFEGLEFLKTIRTDQDERYSVGRCLKAWQEDPTQRASLPSLLSVSSEDVKTALVQYSTRSYDLLGMVPMDFANCVAGISNTMYYKSPVDGSWMLRAIREIKAGGEISEGYCTVDNAQLLRSWGMYIEDNPFRMTSFDPANSKSENLMLAMSKDNVCGNRPKLRDVVSKTLDFASFSSPQSGKALNAPRCKSEVFGMDQGAIRCSLARLAYEGCGDFWKLGPPPPESWVGNAQKVWNGMTQGKVDPYGAFLKFMQKD